MSPEEVIRGAAFVAVALPAAVLVVLTVARFAGRTPAERIVGTATASAAAISAVALAVAAVALAATSRHSIETSIIPRFAGQTFDFDLLIDMRGLLFSLMAALVCAIVAVFGHRYMHREEGYFRFFVQFNLFFLGVLLIGLAGSTTLLFAGWEFLGLSSALLVGFFYERPAPVSNALRVFTVYRLGDAAMLAAVLLAQHSPGEASLRELFGPGAQDALGDGTATAIGLLLVIAAAAKCAQLPFSGWLPRAMEGPTPSSAVFYGALSIHAGAFVLLRASPLLDGLVAARVAIGATGAITFIYATAVGRVQTDVKSALAFASLTQVSVIFIEIALGLYTLALVHMMLHALYRLLQCLRAPSILHEFHEVHQAVGAHLSRGDGHLEARLPARWQPFLYRLALERGAIEGLLDRFVVNPVVTTASRLGRLEQRWCTLLERHSLRTPSTPTPQDRLR